MLAGDAVMGGHVRVGNDEPPRVGRVEEAGGEEPRADENRVVAGRRLGPDEPDALEPCRARLAQRVERRHGLARGVAAGRRDHGVGERLVELRAVGVELVEAAAVAGERPALAGRAPPRLVGLHLEVDDGVIGQRLAHALGREGAAADGDDSAVRAPVEQAQDDLLLASTECGLALALEVRLDRLAELGLDLAVGVERLGRKLGRDLTGGCRLAGSHEADEDECSPCAGDYLTHPMRSS